MLFSSITFLYYFLPVLFIVYFLTPKKFKNLVLLLSSVLFYFWGEPMYLLLMFFSIFASWFLGLFIDKYKDNKRVSKILMIISVSISLGLLCIFKYADFFVSNFNNLTGLNVKLLGLILPIGISFYTFQILSYTIDLYRQAMPVQKNVLNFATYIMLFPQLIAGPIVRYIDIEKELQHRVHSLQGFSKGAMRFCIGLGKKVLISNNLYELCEIYRNSEENSVLFTWIYVVAYALHIYFDFSGYSDMAIGLGHIFGFKFLENFNYPYISKSITEFWRRWHMSLGSFFRDYVYFPMGGNRVSVPKHIFNILVVWALTGFWHGAGWNFIVWGLYFALVLLIEKYLLKDLLEKAPKFISHLYVFVAISISWPFFESNNLADSFTEIGHLFGIGSENLIGSESLYQLRSYLFLIIIAAIGATPIPKMLVNNLAKNKIGKNILIVGCPVLICVLFILTTAYLIDGSFNPFIYFRF